MTKKSSRENFNIFQGTIKFFFRCTITAIIVVSCKSVPVSSPKKDLDFTQYIYKLLEREESKYISLDQIDITVKNGETKNVRAKLNISRGEYIFANINFLGLEIGRILITPDSIKIINRLEKTYYFNKISGLNSILNFDFSYDQVESLILKGVIAEKGENRKRLKSHISEDSVNYNFSYYNSENQYIKSFFNKDTFQKTKIEIVDKPSQFYLLANIFKFNDKGTYPERLNINLKRRDFITEINIIVGRMSFNKLENKSFVINSKYREISF